MNYSKAVDTYLYIKLCFNEAMGHLNIFIIVFEKAVIFATFMKVFGIDNYAIAVTIGIIGVIGMIVGGHITLKKGIAARQISIANRYNPELQKILNGVHKRKK